MACRERKLTTGADAAGKDYWDRAWAVYRAQLYPGPLFEFHELYRGFLPRDERMSCVEIGAMPGNHLVYFHREYGYRVTGIDYCSDVSPIARTMEINGITDYSLVNADVFAIPAGTQYDVVFSSGFAEHFEDYRGVVALHAGLLRKGGYLLITVPNTRYLHKFLMMSFCPEVYAVHRDYLMDRKVLRSVAEALDLEVLHCDYLRTFRTFYPVPRVVALALRAVGKFLRLSHLDRLPNAFASPYLHLVARKP